MCNNEIIMKYMLMNELDPSEVILRTFQQWKNAGYKVKKGEKSHHKIPIWMPSTKKVEVENEDGEVEEKSNGRFFVKNASFFTQEQVEKA